MPAPQDPLSSRSAPFERHSDITRHAAREVDDLDLQPVPARTQMLCPELVELLRKSRQSGFPAGLRLVDGAAAVGTERVRKADDLNLGEPVVDRALDDG